MNELTAGRTNLFLIEADRGYLLVDTGWPWTFEDVERDLAAAGIALDEIAYLLLTHHHDDHAGFAAELIDDVTVIVHESAPALLAAGENHRSGGGLVNWRVYLAAWVLSTLNADWNLCFPPVELDDPVLVSDGDDLGEFGVDATILHTPGHTQDSISLLFEDGRLLCGDAAMNAPRWLGTNYHTIYIGDVEQYYDSWQKILDSPAERIYPAHGPSFDPRRLAEYCGTLTESDLVRRDPISDRQSFGGSPDGDRTTESD